MTASLTKNFQILISCLLLLGITSCKEGNGNFKDSLVKSLTTPMSKTLGVNSKTVNPTQNDLVSQNNSIKSCPPDSVLAGSPYPSGKVQWCVYKDKNGEEVRHGEFRVWHTNGILKAQSFYQDGELEGEYKEWYENKVVKEVTKYSKGKRHGPSVINSKDGKPIEKITYVADERNGPYVKFSRFNTPIEKGNYAQGLKSGVWELYNNNGELRERTEFKADFKHGKTARYGKNKALIATGFYDQNKEIGHWAYYDYRGYKNSEGNLIQGKKHGRWVDYDSSGQKTRVSFFDNGRRVDSYKVEVAQNGLKSQGFGNKDILGSEPPRRPRKPINRNQSNPKERPKPLSKEGWAPL